MRKIIALVALFVSVQVSLADTIFEKYQDIPNPKTIDGGFVSNPDALLSSDEYGVLNLILQRIEDSTSAEVAVVVVNSIGTNERRDYIYRLFNHWGIGKKGKDNGLLLLIVKDQRSWDFETGYGLEGTLPDAKLKFVAENFMVPKFKKDSMGFGIIEAMFVIEKIIAKDSLYTSTLDNALNPYHESEAPDNYERYDDYLTDPEFIAELNSELVSNSIVSLIMYLVIAFIVFVVKLNNKSFRYTFSAEGVERKKINILWWLFVYLTLPMLAPLYVYLSPIEFHYQYDEVLRTAFFIFYSVLGFFVLEKKVRASFRQEHRDVSTYYKAFSDENMLGGIIALIILFPYIFIPYLFWVRSKKEKIRNIPLPCDKCNHLMRKFSPTEKLTMLSEGQQAENRLGSIEYDCWTCDSCLYKKAVAYEDVSKKFIICTSCKFKTAKIYNTTTVTPATYTAKGVGRNDYECQNCKAKFSKNYDIAVMTRSSSSTTYSSSGTSYSSSRSSSSSSRSSSSFGGGRSGGGGSGGRW